jgi:hypothetical protein
MCGSKWDNIRRYLENYHDVYAPCMEKQKNARWCGCVVGLINYNGLQETRVELGETPSLAQSLVRSDSASLSGNVSYFVVKNKEGDADRCTYTSANPDALCLGPCSICTVHRGKRFLTCFADCLASSMLFTIMRDRTASGLQLGEAMRDRRETKTVVFPEPVGSETPIRVTPEARASPQASRQRSW